jgi:hypothetical protein
MLLSMILAIIFSSCYEPKIGCQDINATNFDVSTDKKCENCCTYPKLSLGMNYKFDSANFSLGKGYTDNFADSFKILFAKCFISNIQLIDNNGKILKVSDSLRIYRPNGDSLWISNSFALVGKEGFIFPIGSIAGTGNIKQIRFTVGLNDTIRNTIQSKMPNGHPLAINSDSMYINGQYIANKLVIAKGTNFRDTIRLNITNPFNVTINATASLPIGYDINLPLIIDYKKWFLGVNLRLDSTATIGAKIFNNTALGFGL